MMISVRSSQFTRRSRHFVIIQNQIVLVRYINIQIPFFFQSASYYFQIVFSIVSFSGREKAQIKITRIVINRAACNRLNQKKKNRLLKMSYIKMASSSSPLFYFSPPLFLLATSIPFSAKYPIFDSSQGF